MEENVIETITIRGMKHTMDTRTHFYVPNQTTIHDLSYDTIHYEGAILRRGRKVILIGGDEEKYQVAFYKMINSPWKIESDECELELVMLSDKIFKSSLSAAEWALKQK